MQGLEHVLPISIWATKVHVRASISRRKEKRTAGCQRLRVSRGSSLAPFAIYCMRRVGVRDANDRKWIDWPRSRALQRSNSKHAR
jgi:3-methyladenine DNA glycosylase Mpg